MYSDEEQEYDVEDPGEEFDQKQLDAAGCVIEPDMIKKQKTE
jgi:hypothetical protein